jgi:chorismate mutase / prephenate dehydratase
VKISFHGKRGSYTEAAAAWMFDEDDIATMPADSLNAVVDAVAGGACQYGVLRLESEEAGANLDVLRLLRSGRVYVARQIHFHERYNVASQQDASLDGLRRIYANPTILSICSDFLGSLQGVEIVARYDSAEYLAELLLRGDRREAIICSTFAADHFGLRSLKPGVENDTGSVTRFVAVSNEKIAPPADAHGVATAIQFELNHSPGSLMIALAAFRDHDINITSLLARPVTHGKPEFFAYAEFDGRYDEDRVRTALAELRNHTSYLQLLGSYYTVEPKVTAA